MARKANAKQIDAYLRRQGSPMAGLGSKFIEVGQKYGIDPLLLVAISGAESSFGRNVKGGTFNPFGWGPHRPMGSWGNAIETVGRGLRKGYYDEGRDTPAEIAGKWAPIGAGNDPTNLNSNWTKNVSKFLAELGGGSATGDLVHRVPRHVPSRGAPGTTGDLVHRVPRPGGGGGGLSAATRNMIFGDDDFLSGILERLSQRASEAGHPMQPSQAKPGNPATPALNQIAGEFGPQAMLAIIRQAQKMGLAVRENPFVDKVDPVHTKGSHHYRNFGGKYQGKTLGRGADISGDPRAMADLFKWVRKQYPGLPELIYDPIGSSFDGTFKPGAYGGHGRHVHVGL